MAEPSVEKRLFEEGYSFDFFQAVRLLQRLAPERALIGQGGPPARELVRFRVLPSLTFPPSSIYEITRPTTERPTPAMTVAFLGLTGPSGVLPRHYTETIIRLERERRGEERRALREWLDLFNHRLLSLFFRAWEKYRFWVIYERGEYDRDAPDGFTRAVQSLIGLGTEGLRRRLRVSAVELGRERERPLARVEDLTLLHYAGLLAQRKRNAAGLESLLADYFGVPVRVQQFVGQWLQLELPSRSRLGVVDGNCRLGQDTVAGERVFDCQGKIRIRLGPLSYAQFVEFLPDRSPTPDNKAFFLLVHLVRLYAGSEFDVDVQPVLQANQIPECQLSDELPGPRLGWNTWLTSQQAQEDTDDALFPAEEVTLVDESQAMRL
ncbi:MAG: type VI secretion system baseplate subunit TssG [Gemmataceae bacterium]